MKQIFSTLCFIILLTLCSWSQSLTEKLNSSQQLKGHVTLIGTWNYAPLLREAEEHQGTPYYPDQWEEVKLSAGDTVVQGAGGTSNFYTITATLRQTQRQKEKYWKALQVSPHPTLGYRQSVVLYVITKPVTAGLAKVLKNPQFGNGGAWQLYIPTTEKSKLSQIKTERLQ